MPLARQFRDVELTHHQEVAARQRNERRPKPQQPHVPAVAAEPDPSPHLTTVDDQP